MPSFSSIIDDLAGPGWSAADDFLSPVQTSRLAEDLAAIREAGGLRPAAVAGGGGLPVVLPKTRGDSLLWWEPASLSEARKPLWEALQALRLELNRELFLGLTDAEAHFAYYPPGAGYLKHVDNKRGAEGRVISCAFYLNAGWKPGDGGELTLYPARSQPVVIEPKAGRLAVFLSADLPHEVAPSTKGRSSVVAWLSR